MTASPSLAVVVVSRQRRRGMLGGVRMSSARARLAARRPTCGGSPNRRICVIMTRGLRARGGGIVGQRGIKHWRLS